MTARKTPVAMCCVTIGFNSYLLPADKGMKVFELMQHAVECEKGYGATNYTFAPGGPPNVECKVVRADQVRVPTPEQSEVLRIGR